LAYLWAANWADKRAVPTATLRALRSVARTAAPKAEPMGAM